MTPSIAIVGSGPSGVYTLGALVRSAAPLAITVFEAGDVAGVGTPYDPQLNEPTMLANIASIELPPVCATLVEWLRALGDDQLAGFGIDRATIDERTFYPRIVLGSYYRDQFDLLVQRARAAGHTITVRAATLVVDIIAHASQAIIRSLGSDGTMAMDTFDYAVVANGHRARWTGGASADDGAAAEHAFVPGQASAWRNAAIGVLGTSLSGIDVATGVAGEFGRFEPAADGLRYIADDPSDGFHLTLMSRRGLLPEADFYCPIPYEPLDICTEEAVARALEAEPSQRLDRLFDLFARQLTASDPAYVRQINLPALTADTFAYAYFADRLAGDPLDCARANLAEAMANTAARRTVAWRYTILRMHERLGEAVRQLTDADVSRFRQGLSQVFIDNYAAVPHLSIKRMLALAAAGRLDLVRLGHDYQLDLNDDGGADIATADRRLRFDRLIDARGQAPLSADELPFPTLRLQILANAVNLAAEARSAGREITVNEDLALADGLNRLSRVYCLSIPHLLRRRPFIQGLTSCSELGEQVAEALLDAAHAETDPGVDEIDALLLEMDQTSVIHCLTSNTLLQVPRSAGAPDDRG